MQWFDSTENLGVWMKSKFSSYAEKPFGMISLTDWLGADSSLHTAKTKRLTSTKAPAESQPTFTSAQAERIFVKVLDTNLFLLWSK